MLRAIQLARRGMGRVSPNPMVGCVVVREGQIVAEGHHLFAGKDHAEKVALAAAGAAARGADLYVSLEPCHHHGRTPACTEAIVSAGVRRVFAAVLDPNPLVAGSGIEFLRQSGIQAEVGCLEEKATRLNEHFFHFISSKRPFVLLKLAQTLDGKIAGAGGEARWITSLAARRYSQRLRFQYDAILIGVDTLLQDDPSLDVRWKRRNSILKVILDSQLRTPLSARIFESEDQVVIFHRKSAARTLRDELSVRAELVPVPSSTSGLAIADVLDELGRRKVTSLIVEGGSRVATSFLKARVIQRIHFFYAPKILGDRGLSSIGALGTGDLAQAFEVKRLRARSLPPDILVDARVEGKAGG